MFSKNFFKPQVVKFQRFSRKANAAFLSLHRVVNIGVVCSAIADMELLKSGRKLAVVSLMWSAGVAYATDLAESDTLPDEEALLTVQEDTATSHPAQVDLHEVVVASQRTELHSDSYRMVTQVSGAEISQLPIQTVSDVLKYLPGIDVRTRAANGGQSDVSMRGGTFDQVLVMINGVNLTDSQTGHYSMNLPIPADAIERIEVMQGTSSSLFCLNAFAGAINIVTRPTFLSDTTHCKAKLSGGMYGFANAAASLDWKRGAWTGKVSADYNRSDGYQAPGPTEKEKISIANTDLKCSNVYANAFYKDFELQIGAQYKDAGLGMAYGFGSLDQFDATRTIFGSVGYKHLWGRWGLVSVLSYRANYDRYEWHRGQRLYGNFHFLQTASAVVKTHYVSDFGKTSFGVELRNESLHSTNLGDTINPYGQVPNVEGFALKNVRVLQLVKGCNRLNVSYFVEQSVFCWEPFVASVGVSGNYNTLSGYNMSGGANLGYNYQKGSSVYLNTNRSLRLPTFTDLYYDAGNQLGNRDLLPEEAWTLSIGTKYANEFSGKGRLQFSADGYYR
ncbi:MAG: TonB-dependent receptor, partial [Paludibacteraceae bacterium]|nr:TonB-dependent receptor [Paludibacteraceae bacterium]